MTLYKTIADLPPASATNPQDLLELEQSGTSRRVSLTQLLATSGIPEAPIDGQQYARQSAAWSVVVGGGGGAPSGPAGGALAGTYPNPTLVGGPLSNYALTSSLPTALPPSGPATGDLAGTYPAPTIKADVALTGNPTTTTQATADNTTRVASTAFVKAQSYLTTTTAASTYAPLAAPVFTGDARAVTPTAGDNDTSIATTAFVTTAVAAAVGGSTPTGPAGGDLSGTYPNPTLGWISRVATKTLTLSNTLTLAGTDGSTLNVSSGGTLGTAAFTASSAYLGATAAAGGALAGNYPNPTLVGGPLSNYLTTATAATTYAPLASPALTGNPTAPTATAGDNDTSIATTAFVTAAITAGQPNLTPYALLASPTFTGDPKAPTPLTADNDTSIATTAFVKAQNYLTAVPATYAPLASPVFTGDPQAPTPLTADNDTSIATTAFVKAQGYGTGTLTGVTAGAGITVSGSAPSPTVAITNAITAGSVGDATHIPVLTYNAQGQLTVVSSAVASGSVSSVSVVSANGLAGTVTTATTTPAITLSTTITGLLKGNGTALSAATAGTDYLTAATADPRYLPAVSTAAPGAPVDGQLWFYNDASTGGGQLYIRYNDGNTTQWVPAASGVGSTTFSGGVIAGPADLKVQTVVQSGAALAIDRSIAENCALSLTASITAITVSGWPAAGVTGKVRLVIVNTGAFTVAGWPTGTIWPGGTAPTITSGAAKKDIILLMSDDAGTTIYGSVVGQDYR